MGSRTECGAAPCGCRLDTAARRQVRVGVSALVITVEFEIDIVESWVGEFFVASSAAAHARLGGGGGFELPPVQVTMTIGCPRQLAVLVNPACATRARCRATFARFAITSVRSTARSTTLWLCHQLRRRCFLHHRGRVGRPVRAELLFAEQSVLIAHESR